MRKVFILVIVGLLTVGVFFTITYLRVPLGEPKLRMELYPSPPWQLRPGDSLEVAVGVANDAWLLAWAKDIRVTVLMPEGFTDSRTGTRGCELHFFTLHGGDGLGNGFTIVAANNIPSGNYTITIKLTGQNIPEKTFTPEVVVVTEQ